MTLKKWESLHTYMLRRIEKNHQFNWLENTEGSFADTTHVNCNFNYVQVLRLIYYFIQKAQFYFGHTFLTYMIDSTYGIMQSTCVYVLKYLFLSIIYIIILLIYMQDLLSYQFSSSMFCLTDPLICKSIILSYRVCRIAKKQTAFSNKVKQPQCS